MNIPSKFTKRVHDNLKKYQEIISGLKKKDANEADTVRVVAGMLECFFGYNRFKEITSEHAIRGTYCDLAIIDARKRIRILIEVKAASSTLNDSHVKQAIDYGANAGVSWVILTNAEKWMLYKIKFGKPISKELVSEFNMLSINARSKKEFEVMYAISKDGQGKSSIDELYAANQAKSKFMVGALLNSEEVHSLIRKNIKKLYGDVKISNEEIASIMVNDIIKREILDSEESKKAKKDIEKASKKSGQETGKTEARSKRTKEPEEKSNDTP
ncbi:MAG: type I restriction enzyme HsdR N-terminal domain-containing protein [Treponema sp.]|nr:type I restriction enzyme HsdR N-terminal domain-containing protein [Treponema sp.]